jgi:hypothetical protein
MHPSDPKIGKIAVCGNEMLRGLPARKKSFVNTWEAVGHSAAANPP